MEATLMYLTANDSHLAEDLISALSALFISFFSAETEDENETGSINAAQSTAGTSEQECTDLCPPVNNGPSPVQPGKHTKAIRTSRKSIITWLAGGGHPRDRRRPRHLRFRAGQTARIRTTCHQRFTGRSRGCIRTGDITPCPVFG